MGGEKSTKILPGTDHISHQREKEIHRLESALVGDIGDRF